MIVLDMKCLAIAYVCDDAGKSVRSDVGDDEGSGVGVAS